MAAQTHALQTAGLTAAAVRAHVRMDLGYGWPSVALPCVTRGTTTGFAMEISNKRQPRRLGSRST